MNLYERLTAPKELVGFGQLSELLRDTEASRRILLEGIQGSGAAHIIALIAGAVGGDVLVIADNPKKALILQLNIRTLTELIVPSSVAVLHLPYLDVEAYSKTDPHFHIQVERIVAFHLLANSPVKKILVTTPENLLFPAPPVDLIKSKFIELEKGRGSFMEELIQFLESSGYRRRGITESVGEYSVRGGIVDLFSPLYQAPVRAEYDGDVLGSIRIFDPSNQLSVREIETCRVIPVCEIDIRKDPHRMQEGAVEHITSSFFKYREHYPHTSSLFDYLDQPVIVELDRQVCESIIGEMRSHYKIRYRSSSLESKEIAPPQELLKSDEDIHNRRKQSHIIYISQTGGEKPDTVISFNISSVSFSAVSGKVEDSVKMISGEAAKSELLVIFAGDGHKALALKENETLSRFLPAFIKPIEAPDESALWRVSGFFDLNRTKNVPDLPDGVSDKYADIGERPVILPLSLEGSYKFADIHLTIVGTDELFAPEAAARKAKRKRYFSFSLQDLREGDYIIHYDYGIGQYRGLKKIEMEGLPVEFIELEYADKQVLYIPLDRLDLVDRYLSLEGVKPQLDSLSSKRWVKRRQKVKRSLFDLARTLLNLYASRQLIKGHRFAQDTPLQQKFERFFPYAETEDQLQTIEDVKEDMESIKPMDRLVVGDVGFGKTEVALRAAFKAASEGKQTALIAPTTVLAYQHHRNFKDRLKTFPFKAAMLSRLVPRAEQKDILKKMENGEIDIVIGTHRLLSEDVKFRNLGLLIIDEEQRFGVKHKEKIKMLKHQVDVLTLTATPIPRTLYLAMMGIRDLSIIESPPENRLSIKTEILTFDEEILEEAIKRELSRGGQVYFVHNRIDTIGEMKDTISALAPGASVGIAHGRMDEKELENVMLSFINNEIQVLLSTTIIENGIDIPNVNTLIINNAHRFGLAQLYQLRGRVGRSERQAYCYLVVPEYTNLPPDAKTRLQTLIEFSRLGSGFRIAAIDMELRGSGNILGEEQSGHIADVGFDLYCKMLEEAVAELKGETPKTGELKASIELMADIALPERYIPQTDQRLAIYRKVSSASSFEEIEKTKNEIIDRYGKPPASLDRLLDYGRLRLEAERLGISKIGKDGNKIRIKFEKNTPLNPEDIYRFCLDWKDSVFLPDGQLILPPKNAKDHLDTAKEALRNLAAHPASAAAVQQD